MSAGLIGHEALLFAEDWLREYEVVLPPDEMHWPRAF